MPLGPARHPQNETQKKQMWKEWKANFSKSYTDGSTDVSFLRRARRRTAHVLAASAIAARVPTTCHPTCLPANPLLLTFRPTHRCHPLAFATPRCPRRTQQDPALKDQTRCAAGRPPLPRCRRLHHCMLNPVPRLHPPTAVQDTTRYNAWKVNLADLVSYNQGSSIAYFRGLHEFRWVGGRTRT